MSLAARFAIALALILGALAPTAASAKSPEIYQSASKLFGSKFAAGGYDVVAYHTEGAAKPGQSEFVHLWKGASWRFSSAENLEKFKASPEAFAPQYGGYCAYGVSQGYAVHGDPEQWTVTGGKLYLNYDKRVKANWEKDVSGYITTADKQWPAVLEK